MGGAACGTKVDEVEREDATTLSPDDERSTSSPKANKPAAAGELPLPVAPGGKPPAPAGPGAASIPIGPAAAYHVAPNGSDSAVGSASAPFRTIGSALQRVGRGTIVVHAGKYPERLAISHTGSSDADYLSLVAAPGERVELVGRGASAGEGYNMIYLQNASYVRIDGLRIIGDGSHPDSSGIRVNNAGHHIELLNNEISDMRGQSAMGITVYGRDGAGITDISIRGNKIHDCEPAPSEALTLNGNVKRFEVLGNDVRDVNNIGIDVIGGESLSRVYPSEGVIADNVVTRANSRYDGSAAGIYVDGASQITIERNRVSECDYGIEVGAENRQATVSDVTVRNNFVYRNYRGGIIFGGYDALRGRVTRSQVTHNSLYKNNRPSESTRYNYRGGSNGEIIVQYATDCEVSNNIVYGLSSADIVGGVKLDAPASARWTNNLFFREGAPLSGLPDAHAVVADPLFVAPEVGDLHLRAASPARARAGGDVVYGLYDVGDIDGQPRASASRDIGADQI